MANRVLLGKGRKSGETEYGLWVSKSGQNVLTCGDDQLLFDSQITDGTSGVTSSNGQGLIVHTSGTITGNNVTTTPGGLMFEAITNDAGNVTTPLTFISSTSSGDSNPHIGLYYDSSQNSGQSLYGAIIGIAAGPYNSTGGSYSSGTKYSKLTISSGPSDRVHSYVIFYVGVQE